MAVVDDLEVALGAALVLITLYDVFQSVVLPRPSVGRVRLSWSLIRFGWRPWRFMARRIRRLRAREAVLAAYAPAMVVGMLALWAFAAVAGYALIYNGIDGGLSPRPGSFGAALFFSAGRLLAFQGGAMSATGTAVPLLTSLEAANGFGLFALVISLLFSLFSAFQRRETAVVSLDALAGAPPTGVALLENCAKLGAPEQLASTFNTWREWTADVLESHLAYPLLFFFRSSHDNEAWCNSFGAVMDAATLVVSSIDDAPLGAAHLMLKVGHHFVADLRQYLRWNEQAVPLVEHHEFLEACARLRRAGYTVRDDDQAWQQFRDQRSRYGTWLNRIGNNLAVPPAPWMGDRSYLPHRDRAPRRPRRASA